MKIAVCASEGAPYAKSGGLGDVMEALPKALAAIEGNEVALFLPYYNKIKTNTAYEVEKVAQFRVRRSDEADHRPRRRHRLLH